MASLAYNVGKSVLLNTLSGTGAVNFILLAGYTPSATHHTLADLDAFRVATSGDYTPITGMALTGASVTVNVTASEAILDFNDVVLHNSTITADTVVLYSTGTGTHLICAFDFGADKVSVDGTFTIQWAGDGVIAL